ncbi:ribokinase [Corynebacterium phoceense]|uniref:ribokinase n=1 Tax=Corynebacterium phoceense TaxID=1686286 RepID=UPI00211CFB4C|nr:ribokinase [Corynebacterium phoceense]MCQ9331793.1 ribokinase [Corynebacterium phoceense]
MSPALVVVGSINADLMLHVERHPHPGETLLGSGGEILAGGKGANQAVAAAQLGADVAFVGAVGSDAYAAPALEYLTSSGVDMSAVAELDNITTGLAVITVSADGENTIVLNAGANGQVDGEFVAERAKPVAGAKIVLLQGEIPASGFAAAVQAATGRVIVNLAPVIEVPREALLAADPLMANEHEAGLILSQLGLDDSGTPREMAQRLLEAGFASVVLTLGSAGALVADGDGFTEIPTPRITPVDTTGAGDAFAGAFCARLLEGDSLADAARFAARVGAYAATGAGAQPSYPHLNDELPEV